MFHTKAEITQSLIALRDPTRKLVEMVLHSKEGEPLRLLDQSSKVMQAIIDSEHVVPAEGPHTTLEYQRAHDERIPSLRVDIYVTSVESETRFFIDGRDVGGQCRSFATDQEGRRLQGVVQNLRAKINATIEAWRKDR